MMGIFTKNIFDKSAVASLFIIVFIFLFVSSTSYSQVRNYNLVYSDNIKGGTAMFGNTLLNIVKSDGEVNIVKMNGNSADGNSLYGNDGENMQYIDIDGSSGNGNVTRNSSSSDLNLPAGTNVIKLARLYWGGRINSGMGGNDNINLRTIQIRKGNAGAYSTAIAPSLQVDKAITTGSSFLASSMPPSSAFIITGEYFTESNRRTPLNAPLRRVHPRAG